LKSRVWEISLKNVIFLEAQPPDLCIIKNKTTKQSFLQTTYVKAIFDNHVNLILTNNLRESNLLQPFEYNFLQAAYVNAIFYNLLSTTFYKQPT